MNHLATLLFERHPDPMWIYDLETLRILQVNDAAQQRYGYTHDEFLQLTIKDIRPADDIPALEHNLAHVSQGIDDAGLWRHQTKSGDILHVAITSETLTIEGRRAELVCARDVTEHIRLQSLADTNQERFRLIAKATNDVIWDWNLVTNEVWWNESIDTVCGYARDSLEPDATSWTRRIHPDDLHRIETSIHAVLDGKASNWLEEYRFMHANGKPLHVIDRGFVIRDESGKAVRMLGSMVNVTEQRELSGRLAQAQKMEMVGQLTGGVAHDFNNLLTVILGNTELIHELVDDQELKGLAAMTVSAAKRGAELTQRLLAFARRQALEPQLLNLNEAITDLEPLLRRTLSEHIALELQLDPAIWLCEVDPSQFESALLNLVLNARDALVDGGKLIIETAAVEIDPGFGSPAYDVAPGDYVLVSVSDTGAGMTPDILAQVFEPFFTTKGLGKGSGLGLSMVYGFLKQSGGHARIYSEPGEGTTVKLYFPRAAATSPTQPRTPAPPERRGGTETILVVEDDELVRRHVVNLLLGLGYTVIEATNGPDALVRLEQHPEIAMLFTDIIMPGGINGRQLADMATARYPRLRVLYTSGYTENAIVHHGRLDPGLALLSKPYTRHELAQKLRAVLDTEPPERD